MKTEIQEIFNKIEEVLLDRVYIQDVYEDEDGRHCREIYTIDELNCNILSKLIDNLYDAVENLCS